MTIFKAISGNPARWNGVVGISTLAFLALLGAASADSQHSTELGTNDSGPLEWGLTNDGVRTSLSASDEEFSLGKSMLFRLVVENLGSRAVQFAFEERHVPWSMSIERNDGTDVPCIVPHVQTGFGRGVVLNPGERTVLFEGLDIADQYLLTSPGTYKVRFTGQDGWPGMKDMLSPSAAIPASNEVTIRVADGPVKPSRLLARKLFDAAQASGWRLEFLKEGDVVPSVNGTILAFSHGPIRSIEDAMRAAVWVTGSPSAITPPKPGEDRSSPAEALGRCPWGEVYLWSKIASPEELSTVREFTATALTASADSQHSTELATNDSGPLEWGPTKDGVRTGLSAREEGFSLGKPMLFRLVMENVGSRTVQFDPQRVAVNSSMSIERSDGTSVPYIAGGFQTAIMGDLPILKPRERKVLFEALDIADQYLLTSPGTYKVQFRGQGEGFARVAIPASNAVTISVTDGPLQPSRLLARTLFDAMQASGWRLAIYKERDIVPVGRSSVSGTALALTRDGRNKHKGDAPRVLIWVTASPSAITPPQPDVEQLSPAEAIGRCQWGEVYLWSANASAEELSTVRKLTATALEIDER